MSRSPTLAADTPALIGRALRLCTMLRNWPDRVLDRLTAVANLQRYERRTQVLANDRQRREVLVVVSGCLEVSGVNAAGAKFVLSMHGAGEILGLVRLLEIPQRMYDYHAHEDTVLVHLPSDGMRAILDEHPLLWKDVALLALERQRESILMMQRRAFGELDQSVAEALVRLSLFNGQPTEDGRGVLLRVSQSDLAAMVSVSRQTINKELRLLAQRGLVSAEYGRLVIHDIAALRRLADGRPPRARVGQ